MVDNNYTADGQVGDVILMYTVMKKHLVKYYHKVVASDLL